MQSVHFQQDVLKPSIKFKRGNFIRVLKDHLFFKSHTVMNDIQTLKRNSLHIRYPGLFTQDKWNKAKNSKLLITSYLTAFLIFCSNRASDDVRESQPARKRRQPHLSSSSSVEEMKEHEKDYSPVPSVDCNDSENDSIGGNGSAKVREGKTIKPSWGNKSY